jgi:rRNA small subunit pseudouridine methyltransferase Nep1
MLHVILLEAALELVPPELSAKKMVQKQAYRRKKKPNEILLDQTYHGQAMTQLNDGTRRGRPDIVFFCLQSLLETPLCKAGLMTVHIQLYDGRIIQVDAAVRIPRNYERFVGLMEQLLLVGQVPPEGAPLLKIQAPGLGELISSLRGSSKDSLALLAVEGGKHTGLNDLMSVLPSSLEAPVILGIGAFPHGGFQHDLQSLFDIQVELDYEVMMAWHVCSEVLWAYSLKHDVVSERYLLEQ